MARRGRQSKITRDLVLFVGGLVGIAYETVVERVDRPALLAVFAGMLGLPWFIRRDEKRDEKRDDDNRHDHRAKGE